MSDNSFGEIILPLHCRASASSDKTKVALTFQCNNRAPLTIVMPVAGAAGLQRSLAQALYILTAQPKAPEAMAEPAAVAAE